MKEQYGYISRQGGSRSDGTTSGGGILCISGEWHLTDTVYLSAGTSVRLEGAELFATAGVPLFRNTVVRTVRERTKLGCQSGISLLGDGSALHGSVEFFNVKNVVLEHLSFEGAGTSLVLMYASGVRAAHLMFRNVETCIECRIGTRNGIFTDIHTTGGETLFRFDSERLPAARRVNYAGPDVKNIIVRDASGGAFVTVGAYCKDILTEN